MTGVIIVCRMSSSRLPGKTLMPFGAQSLLGHIVARIEAAGFNRADIAVCTSTDESDRTIWEAATALGCKSFAGSLENVSRRILDAAAAHKFDDYLLILGDNPWIDPEQIRAIREVTTRPGFICDYAVTATPELAYRPEDELFYPIGTRIQYIRRAYMQERLAELEAQDETVREHASRLFLCLPNGTRYQALYAPDGLSKAEIGMLNISINTRADYDTALAALDAVSDPLAPARAVTDFYLGNAKNPS